MKHSEVIRRHHNFGEWTERQKVTTSTVACLNAIALAAPAKVKSCMQPQYIGTPEAEFYSHHIIILGVKR